MRPAVFFAVMAACTTREEVLVVVPTLEDTEALVVVVRTANGDVVEVRAVDVQSREGSPFSPAQDLGIDDTHQLTAIEYGRPLSALMLPAGSLPTNESGCPIPGRPLRTQRLVLTGRDGQWAELPGIPPDLESLRIHSEPCGFDCSDFVVDRVVELPLLGRPGFAFAVDDHRLLVGVNTVDDEFALYVVDSDGSLATVTHTGTTAIIAGTRVGDEVWLGGESSLLVKVPLTDVVDGLSLENARPIPSPPRPLGFRRLAHSGRTVFAHTANRRVLAFDDQGAGFSPLLDPNRPKKYFERGGLVASGPDEAILAYPDEDVFYALTPADAAAVPVPGGKGVSALLYSDRLGAVLAGLGWAVMVNERMFDLVEVADSELNLDALIATEGGFLWAGSAGTLGEYSATRHRFCPTREDLLHYHARLGLRVADAFAVVSDWNEDNRIAPAVTFFHSK